MATTPDLRTVNATVFSTKVNEVVTSLNGADKNLVMLVLAAGRRWYDDKADRGGCDVIKNLVNRLADFPLMQSKTISALKTFAPLDFEAVEGKDGEYKVSAKISLSALNKEDKAEVKAAFIKAVDDFEAANYKRITDFGKRSGEAKQPKKLDLLTTAEKGKKAVEKVLEKAQADGVDRGAALNTIAAWIDEEIKKLSPNQQAA
ncbi:hypothetical protein DFV88_24835 [Salmonella enterica subsp. enterica serovar Newport]|nr:hypothetical protein [Salmonella enterica subsp. enterica serovar Newport]